MRQIVSTLIGMALLLLGSGAQAQGKFVTFDTRSAHSGLWSDPHTWAKKRLPKAGDIVQIRQGDSICYDLLSTQALRMIHIAGTLTFARNKSTLLQVGLLKVQPGEQATEDGFNCDMHPGTPPPASPKISPPLLEIGTTEHPIPAGVSATIRLVYFEGADRETSPAIIVCGGRWEAHGAPLNHTWVKLGQNAKPGETTATLDTPVTGWRPGDRVIVTASKEAPHAHSFRPAAGGAEVNTEERKIVRLDGMTLTLDRPLDREHSGSGDFRSEVANLSRNVIVESATPDGVRGHTMYHLGSTGSLSYAEFRHLGKEGVLGKYPLHFHLAGTGMRGSRVLGVSVWDSHNRWITIHGTDYLLVQDCVGYQSVGHGFFLEDGTEQYNVLDHNLAVQAFRGKKLPKQVLSFDENEGAGFWWANGRNVFTRNVACENDEYGFRFDIQKRSNFDPVLPLRKSDGTTESRDVRTLPFLRFEGNESHSEGLYSFNFGEDVHPSVHGDRQHPFIARDLKVWESHYALRPNVQFFLMDGLSIFNTAYGVYHPDYDAHVYRNLTLNGVDTEPINRGHDDDSIQYGSFTYDHLTLENCRVGRDPLVQLTCTSPSPGQTGHFRSLVIKNCQSPASIVDLGGGPRSSSLQNGVLYYFHDYFGPGRTTCVSSVHFPDLMHDGDYRPIANFTGKDVRAADVSPVPFPTLLDPVDDFAPTTCILSARQEGSRLRVEGVSSDNGEVASVTVNGRKATILSQAAGVAHWAIVLPLPLNSLVTARAEDRAGNREQTGHVLTLTALPSH